MIQRVIRRFVLASLALWLGACASSLQTRLLDASPPDIPPMVELEAVPFHAQTAYHCGPAALAGILNYRGVAVTPDEIARLVYVPGLKGSLQVEIAAATRQHGMLAISMDGQLESLLRELDAGNPVFVLHNLALDAWPQWHYETLIGYDLARGHMILRSGEDRRVTRDIAVFEKTWQRADHWALVIIEPGSIPASVGSHAYLDAVMAMEQVGRVADAQAGYAAATARWPDSSLAFAGLGNTHFALGDFEAAETAYRAALARDPNRAGLWNNLAYALARQGLRDASLEAVGRAMAIEPQNPDYRESLAELSR